MAWVHPHTASMFPPYLDLGFPTCKVRWAAEMIPEFCSSLPSGLWPGQFNRPLPKANSPVWLDPARIFQSSCDLSSSNPAALKTIATPPLRIAHPLASGKKQASPPQEGTLLSGATRTGAPSWLSRPCLPQATPPHVWLSSPDVIRWLRAP